MMCLLLAASLGAAPQGEMASDRGGAAPYAPTKGEWLCLLLNSRQALINSERPSRTIGVHYLYDVSRPDVVRVRVLYLEGANADHVHMWKAQAEQHAIDVARTHGWQKWLKVEVEEQTISSSSPWDELIQ